MPDPQRDTHPQSTWLRLYTERRMGVLLALGFASGLPATLLGRPLKIWAGSCGIDLGKIGMLSLLTLPYTFKFLWAPLMDRYVPPLLGRRRGWLLVTQLGLMVLMAWMALHGPRDSTSSLTIFAALALIVAFWSASQDIVADAYRTDILEEHELGAGASIYAGGYRVAMIGAGAGAVFLAGQMSWQNVYLLGAAGMGIGVVATLLAREPAGARHHPPTLRAAVIEPAEEFISRRKTLVIPILLFLLLFKLPDYLAQGMGDQLLLQHLKFSKEQIAFWSLGAGTAVTIPGVLVGGPLVTRLGLYRSLLVIGIVQAASNAGYLILACVGAHYGLMIGAVAVEYFCTGLVVTGFTAFLMHQCDRRYSATQYALFTGLMALSSALSGACSGYLAKALGYPLFFAATILAAGPGLILVWWMRRDLTQPSARESEISAGAIDF